MMQNAECDDALALGSWLGTDADAGKYGAHDGESASCICMGQVRITVRSIVKLVGDTALVGCGVLNFAKLAGDLDVEHGPSPPPHLPGVLVNGG